MPTRPLGEGGPLVSRLGLGTAALGRPGYLNLGHGADLEGVRAPEALEARAHEVLDAAWAGGVRYVDAARSYGLAERFLGRWLRAREVGRGEIVVGSKWGYAYTAGWRVDAEVHEEKEHSARRLRAQWAESRAELGDHLDLYQIHSATLATGVLDDAEVLTELARIRAGGTRVGLSLSGPDQARTLARALAVRVDGERLFDAVQATWNPLEPSAAPALAEAHAAGLGVIVKEALANGRLTDRNRLPADRDALAALRRQAERLGVGLDAVALAAALARPWADVVLSGAAAAWQLEHNLAALAVAWDDEAEAALAAAARPAEAYWRERGEQRWT